jgi:uncharacterized C2H2 Zn-finger protein
MKHPGHDKKAQLFNCEICDYTTSCKSKYDRHVLTGKHVFLTNETKKGTDDSSTKPHGYPCQKCKKVFNSRTTLWRHNNACLLDTANAANDSKEEMKQMTSMIMQLMTQNSDLMSKNSELMNTIREMIPVIGSHNNNTTNNINKTKNFNIQFFLNETCKDALNISEFVNSLKITLEDLDVSKKHGLVRGITDVMVKGLKELDITKRPIHCTDKKRETMYIKDNERWEKDETHEKMRNTIIEIAGKERNALKDWVEENPNWMETEAKQIEYLTIMRNVCEPIEDDDKNNKKIIRNITTNVFVDKMP